MKKYLFMLLSLCVLAFVGCDESEDGMYSGKETPVLKPNSSYLTFGEGGGSTTILVDNAIDLNIVKVNDKTSDKAGGKETNVKSVEDGSIKDSKNVTEGEWVVAKIVSVDGVYKQINITVSANTGGARTKFLHLTCGGNLLGLSLVVNQSGNSSSSASGN